MTLVTVGIVWFPFPRTGPRLAPRTEPVALEDARSRWVCADDGLAFVRSLTVAHADAAKAWQWCGLVARSWNRHGFDWMEQRGVAIPYIDVPVECPSCPQCRGRSRWSVGSDPTDPLNLVPDVCEDCDREAGRPW